MKEEITYVAADCTEFENKNNCIAYEDKLYHAFIALIINAEFLDEDNKRMLPNNIEENYWAENDMCFTELDHIYNTCTYIDVKKDLPYEVINYNERNYGFGIPTKKGKYRYNAATDAWERMEI